MNYFVIISYIMPLTPAILNKEIQYISIQDIHMARPRQSPNATAHIKQMIDAGYTYDEIRNEYKVSPNFIWSIAHGIYNEYIANCKLEPLDQIPVKLYRLRKLRK